MQSLRDIVKIKSELKAFPNIVNNIDDKDSTLYPAFKEIEITITEKKPK